jgi:hypothetical protein
MRALTVLLLAILLASATSAGPADGIRAYGKPRAPVRIEWVAEGEDGRIAADIYPRADYERLDLILVLPGRSDAGLRRILGPGAAGSELRVEWNVDPSGAVPRLLAIMDVEGRQMKRASAAPAASAAAARRHRAAGPGRVDRDAGLRVLPAVREREP